MWPASRRLCRASALHLWRSLAATPESCSGVRTLVTRSDEEYDALLHGARTRRLLVSAGALGFHKYFTRSGEEEYDALLQRAGLC